MRRARRCCELGGSGGFDGAAAAGAAAPCDAGEVAGAIDVADRSDAIDWGDTIDCGDAFDMIDEVGDDVEAALDPVRTGGTGGRCAPRAAPAISAALMSSLEAGAGIGTVHARHVAACTSFAMPQDRQKRRCSGEPHSLQKREPSGFRLSHSGQTCRNMSAALSATGATAIVDTVRQTCNAHVSPFVASTQATTGARWRSDPTLVNYVRGGAGTVPSASARGR